MENRKLKIILLSVTGLFVLLLLVSLPDRSPHLDDAWLSEHSYWLLKDGTAKCKLMTGVAESDQRLLLHHKLFTLQGAAIIDLLGFRLYALKSVSFFYLIVLMLMLYVAHRSRWFSEPGYFLLSALLLLSNPLIFEYSYVFRPEIMMAFLGFAGAWMIIAPDGTRRSWLMMLAGGLLAGAAMATHLNGIVFVVAGGMFLLTRKNWTGMFIFGIGAAATGMIFFYDFTSINDLDYWFYQLHYVPSGEDNGGFLSSMFMKLIDEQRRYLHSPKEIAFTVLLVTGLLMSWKKIRREQSGLLLYTFLIIITLAALSVNKTSKYLILVLPFLVLIFISSYIGVVESGHRVRIRVLNGMLVIYLAISLVYDLGIATRKFDGKINAEITRTYAGDDSLDIRVLAPMQFIFGEMGHYQRIVSLMSFNERMKLDNQLTDTGFLTAVGREHISLILLPQHYQQKFGLEQYHLHDSVGDFMLVEKSDSLMVWKQLELVDIYYPSRPKLQYSEYGFDYLGAFD